MGAAGGGRPRWILRGLGLALVVGVLVTQVHVHDRLEAKPAGGEGPSHTYVGRVTETADGWDVADADTGAVRHVTRDEVVSRGHGETRVPAVTWGMASLGSRLGARPLVALEVLLLLFVTYLVTAWRWRELLGAVDVALGLGEAVRLNLVGAFFNMAVPGSTGGDVVKAWYAARATRRGVRAVLSVFADRIVGLLGLALFAAGALVVLAGSPGLEAARTITLVALVMLGAGSWVVLSPRLRRWLGLGRLASRLPFHTVLSEVAAALRLYRERPRALLLALLVSMGNHALASVAVYLLAGGLGIQGLTFGRALALVPVANLFGAIPLLPGGWGVGEAAFAYLFSRVGIPPTEAVTLSVVYRLGMLVTSLPGGALWLLWRGRPSRDEVVRTVDAAGHVVEALEAEAERAEEGEPEPS